MAYGFKVQTPYKLVLFKEKKNVQIGSTDSTLPNIVLTNITNLKERNKKSPVLYWTID
jgi:hypothetical protein